MTTSVLKRQCGHTIIFGFFKLLYNQILLHCIIFFPTSFERRHPIKPSKICNYVLEHHLPFGSPISVSYKNI